MPVLWRTTGPGGSDKWRHPEGRQGETRGGSLMASPTQTDRERVFRALCKYGRRGTTSAQLSSDVALPVEMVRDYLYLLRSSLNWRAKGASLSRSVSIVDHEPETAIPATAAQLNGGTAK